MPENAPPAQGTPYIVTTALRGVFYGYCEAPDKARVTLRAARHVLCWGAKAGGFMGLAANGPDPDTRVGAAGSITLFDLTSFTEVSPAAAAAFDGAP